MEKKKEMAKQQISPLLKDPRSFDQALRAMRYDIGYEVASDMISEMMRAISENPSWCAAEYALGNTLLHSACTYRAPMPLLELLIKTNPDAAGRRNLMFDGSLGLRPLDYWDYENSDAPPNVVQLFDSHFPRCVSDLQDALEGVGARGDHRRRKGLPRGPNWEAAVRLATREACQFLVAGKLPLDIVTASPDAPAKVVKAVLLAYPEALSRVVAWVVRIEVWTGDLVDMIVFHMSDGAERRYGAQGGKRREDFVFADREYLVEVQQRSGAHLDAVTFRTSSGRYRSYGNTRSGQERPSWKAAAGKHIVGLARPSEGWVPALTGITEAYVQVSDVSEKLSAWLRKEAVLEMGHDRCMYGPICSTDSDLISLVDGLLAACKGDVEVDLLSSKISAEKLVVLLNDLGLSEEAQSKLLYRLHYELKYPLPSELIPRNGLGERSPHEKRGIDFPGRIIRGQKFFIASFPGIYQLAWHRLVGAKVLSSACVFFPNGSAMFGKHPECDCQCKKLYDRFSEFKGWPDGKAPFGCDWFAAWRRQVDAAVQDGQEIVVVYKRQEDWETWETERVGWHEASQEQRNGWKWSVEGVGKSQQGEIAYIYETYRDRAVHHYVVDDLPRLNILCRINEDSNYLLE